MSESSATTMKIGIVMPYLKSRGTEKQALALAKGFRCRGADIVLFVVQGWGLDHMYKAFVDAEIEVVNVGPPIDVGQKRVRVKRVLALARLARKHQCDILLSRAAKTNQICGIAALLVRIPSVVVLSGAVAASRAPKRRVLLEWLATFRWQWLRLGFPSRVVTVSKESGDNLISTYPLLAHRVLAISNGLAVEAIRTLSNQSASVTLPRHKFNLCYTGSIELKRKGLDILLEAMNLLVNDRQQDDICLTLVGSGEDQAKAALMVKSFGLEKHVLFAGEVENPFTLVKQADAFVLSSRREGLPNVLLEAMSLEVCAIAADCNTGPREIIENGVNGLLVPVADSHELAAAILRIKADPLLKARLARSGYQTILSAFSYRGMVDGYYRLLSQLANTASKKRTL